MSIDRLAFEQATTNARVHYQQLHQGDATTREIDEVYLNIMSDSILLNNTVRAESPTKVMTIVDCALHVLDVSVRVYGAFVDRIVLLLGTFDDYSDMDMPSSEEEVNASLPIEEHTLVRVRHWAVKAYRAFEGLREKVEKIKSIGELSHLELALLGNVLEEYQTAYYKASDVFYVEGFTKSNKHGLVFTTGKIHIDTLKVYYDCPLSYKIGEVWMPENMATAWQEPVSMDDEEVIDVIGKDESSLGVSIDSESSESESEEPPRKRARIESADTATEAKVPMAPKKKRRSYVRKRMGGFPVEKLSQQYEYLSSDERLGYIKCLHTVSKCFDGLHYGEEGRDLFKKVANELSVSFFQ